MTITTKRIRNELRTAHHTVWYDPAAWVFVLVDAFGQTAYVASHRTIDLCALVWPGERFADHWFDITRIQTLPVLEVDASDPREAVPK